MEKENKPKRPLLAILQAKKRAMEDLGVETFKNGEKIYKKLKKDIENYVTYYFD
jgi:hypothetical protein